MSLRYAALKGLMLIDRLYAKGWTTKGADHLDDNYGAYLEAKPALISALGIGPIYAEHDADLTPIGLLETLAESLARDDATKLLAGAVQAALAEHKRGAMVTQMLAAAE